MNFAVRCPSCDALARVPIDAAGRVVGCPRCGTTFTAEPDTEPEPPPPPPPVPVVARRSRPTGDDIPTVYPAKHAHRHLDISDTPHGPMSVLIGLALLPFAIPLVWLAAPALVGREPVFTIMVPIAVALAAAGLSLGAVLAADWRFATRLKGVLAVLAVGYAAAAFFYFLQPAWVEAVRRGLGGAPPHWLEFAPDGDTGPRVQLPGQPKPDPADVLAGWPLRAYRYADRRRHTDTFIVAHGPADPAVRAKPDDAFFAAATAAAAAAVNGTIVSEKPLTRDGRPARQLVIALPDKASTRTLQVIRVGERACVAAVEGPFLPPDAKEVREYFEKFHPPKKR